LAFIDLPVEGATFFAALAAGFFGAGFFTGLEALACDFVTFEDADFFAGAFDLAGDLELFFFAEMAIFGRRLCLAGRERRLTKEHFQPGARGDFPVKNEQKERWFGAVYELALE
jgi:hypothetical protein